MSISFTNKNVLPPTKTGVIHPYLPITVTVASLQPYSGHFPTSFLGSLIFPPPRDPGNKAAISSVPERTVVKRFTELFFLTVIIQITSSYDSVTRNKIIVSVT